MITQGTCCNHWRFFLATKTCECHAPKSLQISDIHEAFQSSTGNHSLHQISFYRLHRVVCVCLKNFIRVSVADLEGAEPAPPPPFGRRTDGHWKWYCIMRRINNYLSLTLQKPLAKTTVTLGWNSTPGKWPVGDGVYGRRYKNAIIAGGRFGGELSLHSPLYQGYMMEKGSVTSTVQWYFYTPNTPPQHPPTCGTPPPTSSLHAAA